MCDEFLMGYVARWDFDYFGSNKYLYYILSIK